MRSRPNGLWPEHKFGEVSADLRNLKERQREFEQAAARRFGRIQAGLDALERSINKAVLYLAIGAGAIIFELLRKGVSF